MVFIEARFVGFIGRFQEFRRQFSKSETWIHSLITIGEWIQIPNKRLNSGFTMENFETLKLSYFTSQQLTQVSKSVCLATGP
jgi:hypothetical protein